VLLIPVIIYIISRVIIGISVLELLSLILALYLQI